MDKKKLITIAAIAITSIIAIFIGVKFVTRPNASLDELDNLKLPSDVLSTELSELAKIEITDDDISFLFAMNFPRMPVPRVTDSLGINFIYSYAIFLEEDYNLIASEMTKLKDGTGSPSDLLALLKPSILMCESNIDTLIKFKDRAPENKIITSLITTYKDYLAELKSQRRFLLDRVITEDLSAVNNFVEEYKDFTHYNDKIKSINDYFEIKYDDEATKFSAMVIEYVVKNKDYDVE